MNRYGLTRRDIVGVLVGIAIACAAGFVGFKLSVARMQANWGFGPEWECSNVQGLKDLVCIKKIPPTDTDAIQNSN
jgi:hypothetical protein